MILGTNEDKRLVFLVGWPVVVVIKMLISDWLHVKRHPVDAVASVSTKRSLVSAAWSETSLVSSHQVNITVCDFIRFR